MRAPATTAPDRSKRVVRPFVYAALTPVVLASIAGVAFAGGHMLAVLFVVPIVAIVVAPVAIAFTVVFGIPLYYVFRRFEVTSVTAYLLAGLALSLPVAAYFLWSEYTAGYLNENQALLNHATVLVSLISGPAATVVFRRTVRLREMPIKDQECNDPQIHADSSSRKRDARAPLIATGAAVLIAAWFVYSVMLSLTAASQGRAALFTEHFPFDSTRSVDLILSLDAYAREQGAHLTYYFMPLSSLLMIELRFPDNAEIIVTTTGSSRRELTAFVYHDGPDAASRIQARWEQFIAYFRPVLARANSLVGNAVPRIPPYGEGGAIPRSPL